MVDIDELRLRREAMHVAALLPLDPAEALMILKLTEELVRGFLSGKGGDSPPPPKSPLRLV